MKPGENEVHESTFLFISMYGSYKNYSQFFLQKVSFLTLVSAKSQVRDEAT
jgi:hypothetical protein